MIKRETYMNRIRPFIGNDLIKVLTGIRRSGKSVMLDLIQDELADQGFPANWQLILPGGMWNSFPSMLSLWMNLT